MSFSAQTVNKQTRSGIMLKRSKQPHWKACAGQRRITGSIACARSWISTGQVVRIEQRRDQLHLKRLGGGLSHFSTATDTRCDATKPAAMFETSTSCGGGSEDIVKSKRRLTQLSRNSMMSLGRKEPYRHHDDKIQRRPPTRQSQPRIDQRTPTTDTMKELQGSAHHWARPSHAQAYRSQGSEPSRVSDAI